MKQLLFILSTIILASCGKIHGTNTSVWADGLWIIPVGLLGASAFSFYKAYIYSKSGSEQQVPGQGIVSSDKNVSFFKVHAFKFAVAFLIAAIAVIIAVNGSK